jgi:hypothetical protein
MNKKSIALLATIVVAMGNADTPYHFASVDELKELTKAGFVETNPDIKDATGKLAARATEAGLAANTAAIAKSAAPHTPAPELIVGTGFEAPAHLMRKKAETYKFDDLAVGGFIFVAATADKPTPAKSLASTVSAATKRYATPIPGQMRKDRNGKDVQATTNTRLFGVVPVTAGVAYGAFTAPADGAVIFRKPDAVAATPAA